MKTAEYNRVANRGIASASLATMNHALEQFRMSMELAGIRVNERVIGIKDLFTAFGQEIASDSYSDQWDLEDRPKGNDGPSKR